MLLIKNNKSNIPYKNSNLKIKINNSYKLQLKNTINI